MAGGGALDAEQSRATPGRAAPRILFLFEEVAASPPDTGSLLTTTPLIHSRNHRVLATARSTHRRLLDIAYCAAILLSTATAGRAQVASPSSPADTSRAVPLETVVVTATRSASAIETSTAAVTRLDRRELEQRPLRTVADALASVPGLAFLDFGGSGYDPQLTVRGFYGGGEAEYAVVMLDGVPVNRLETGRVDWDLIPVASIEAIEIVRGSASALYGDAAVGAVINVITRRPNSERASLTLAAGQLGELEASGTASMQVGDRALGVFGRVHRIDGYRAHSGRRASTFGGSIPLVQRAGTTVTVSSLHDWRTVEDPGPLTELDLVRSRVQSSPFYRFDESNGQRHRLTVDGSTRFGARTRASGYVSGEHDRSDAVRTLRFAPDFADSKVRDVRATAFRGSVQLEHDVARPRWGTRLVVGSDFSAGRLGTEYFDYLLGDSSTYRTADATRGESVARGDGTRATAAGFANLELRPHDAVRVSIGSRLDWLEDRWEPSGASAGDPVTATHLAMSPKVGVNVRYLHAARHTGHAYASAGRAFKAPTPGQLFDPRPIPIPVEPYSTTISNALLDPQQGVNVEAGAYHTVDGLPRAMAARVTLAAYQTDMRDELDFDFQTFRYINLARSRHRGLETGLQLRHPSGSEAFVSYTAQAVTSRFGQNSGRYLRAVPGRHLSAGASATHRSGLAATATVNRLWRMYLDDANAVELPAFAQVDLRVSQRVDRYRLALEVFNALDRRFSPTGFPDPSGSELFYYHPAAGRRVRVAVSAGL